MRIEYHRTLIADRARNAALYAALKAVIVPGETTVADIGAGTGLLGLMAAKLGARRVYLYESEAVANVAAAVIKANRLRHVEIIPGHSTEVIDPPQVDVVVSETLGNYALEENIIATLADARKRHLAPGGVLIPSAIEQFAAPVLTDRIHRELLVWDGLVDDYGLDLAVARTMSLNNIYVRSIAPDELLQGGGRRWDRVDLGRDARSGRSGEASWVLAERATVHGFAVWWTASLGGDVSLSTAPGSPATHWEQLYLPLLEPIAASSGETVALSIRSKSSYEGGTHLAWTATLTNAAGRRTLRQGLDLEKGWLP
jgi:SAM-dependent methyltransferase